MNHLYYGDNLEVIRRYLPDECVDLIYLDPPFNSNASYNVLFQEHDGARAAAQIQAFEDSWRWDENAARAYQQTVEAGGKVSEALQGFRRLAGESDMLAYLSMMAPRLVELWRVLKPTGSIYLHCDPTASHYLKLLLDAVFGPKQFLNEIAWKRTSSHNDPRRYGRISDRLLFYGKTQRRSFNVVRGEYSQEQLSRYKYEDEGGLYRAENLTAPHFSRTRTVNWRGTHPGTNRQWRFGTDELERLYAEGRILFKQDGTPRKDGLKVYLHEAEGQPLQDMWTDIVVGPTSSERLGYPTQKPLALLERIISASSSEGEVVLDPFCGCGTTVDAAQKLGRNWVGIDITHLAISLIRHRLADTYGDAITGTYEVIGEPTSVPDARILAESDPFQFQVWALGLVNARPNQAKKGADRGIDGVLYFHEDAGSKTKRVLISVKAGKPRLAHVRELHSVIEREQAEIGVLILMHPPTRAMRSEAVSAGVYESPWGKHPRIQVLTVSGLLEGAVIDMPRTRGANVTFKRARQYHEHNGEQLDLREAYAEYGSGNSS
jgi:site-specific DNA-methyltransferase (adenine-specific)